MSIQAAYAQANPGERAISPVSIYGALAVLGYGASGTAQQQLMRTLNVTDRAHFLHMAHQVKQSLQGSDIKGATGMYFNSKDSSINTAYYIPLKDDVYMAQVDFGNPDQAAVIINKWIQENSGFQDVMHPDELINAEMVLANALWFKDQWNHQFNKDQTTSQNFTRLDESVTQVPLMTDTFIMDYSLENDLTAVRLGFKNGATAEFVMGLPAENAFTQIINYQNGRVELHLPRFEIERDIDLDSVFQAAGLTDIYKPGFSYIRSDGSLFVSKSKQKVLTRFDEEGAEVRAATTITMARGIALEEHKVVIRFDRPFHFRIVKHGLTLVEGLYNSASPTAE